MRVQDPITGTFVELPEVGLEPHSGIPSETRTAKSFALPDATVLSIAEKPDAVDAQAWREYLSGLAKWAGEFPAAREAFTRMKASAEATVPVTALIQQQLATVARSSHLEKVTEQLKPYGVSLKPDGRYMSGEDIYKVIGGEPRRSPPSIAFRAKTDLDVIVARATLAVGVFPKKMRPFVDKLSATDRQTLTSILRDASINPRRYSIESRGDDQWFVFQKISSIDATPDALTIRFQDDAVLQRPMFLELSRTAEGALKCITRSERGLPEVVRI